MLWVNSQNGRLSIPMTNKYQQRPAVFDGPFPLHMFDASPKNLAGAAITRHVIELTDPFCLLCSAGGSVLAVFFFARALRDHHRQSTPEYISILFRKKTSTSLRADYSDPGELLGNVWHIDNRNRLRNRKAGSVAGPWDDESS